MARCACGNQTCSCVVQATPNGGITVSGNGSPTRPYQIGMAGGGNQLLNIKVADTPTLDLTLTGSGTSTDKLTILGNTLTKLTDLKDVADPEGPQTGDVPVWMGTHWEFKPPPSAPVGAVNATGGIAGDGSGGNPLHALTSGTWPLPLFTTGSPQDSGLPVYLDSTGRLRTRPQTMRGPKPVTDLPATYPYGMTVMGLGTADAAAWPAASSCVVVTYAREDTPVVQQWCYLNTQTAAKAWLRSGNTAWSPWTLVVSDTGWQPIAITAGFTSQGTEIPQVRLFNGVVYSRGGWSGTGLTVNATITGVGTVPAGFRPTQNVIHRAGSSGGAATAEFFIGSSGNVDVRMGPTSSYVMLGASWLTD